MAEDKGDIGRRGPLEGIRVLDWTIWQMGPWACSMLGDLGAEVIKIEDRRGGDPGRNMKRIKGVPLEDERTGKNIYFECHNRNKKSITVDLTKPEGREVVYRLVEKSDVFLQNFRYGVADKLGMGYETLAGHNPRLIYASGTGFGPLGPDRASPAYDYLGLARSGIMTLVGEPDMEPQNIVGGLSDQMGGIMLAYSVLAALVARERYGVGQRVDSSLLGAMLCLEGLPVSLYGLQRKQFPRQARATTANPMWNHYRCKDGKWIALAHLQSDRYWAPFCAAIGEEGMATDPRFLDLLAREKHAGEAISVLDRVFATKTYDEWFALLHGDFIVSMLRTLPDLFEEEQVRANDYIIDYDHPVLGPVQMVGFPARYEKTPPSMRLPAPELGEHTEEILLEIAGYGWEEIERLRAAEVV